MRRLPVISAIAFTLLASCGSDGRVQREPQAPLVQALTVEEHRFVDRIDAVGTRSEEHTSELQSLMRISYAVFCLKKKQNKKKNNTTIQSTCPHRKHHISSTER